MAAYFEVIWILGLDISNCKSLLYEWCVMERELIIVDKGLMCMEKGMVPIT